MIATGAHLSHVADHQAPATKATQAARPGGLLFRGQIGSGDPPLPRGAKEDGLPRGAEGKLQVRGLLPPGLSRFRAIDRPITLSE
jgi:hypothetical protein